MFRQFACALAAAAFVLTLCASPSRAHEGHDHGPQAPLAPASVAPRGEAQSDHFELVAVAQKDALLVYLDRFATNEPVDGATIEIETPEGPAKAEPHGHGLYRLNAPWLANSQSAEAHLDLIVTVTAGDATDILPISLDIPAPESTEATRKAARLQFRAQVVGLLQSPYAAAAGGFLAGLVVMLLMRPRRRSGTAAILIAGAALLSTDGFAHEGHSHGEPAPAVSSEERAMRQPDGAIFVPKSIQRIFDLRTIQASTGTFRRSVELPGRIIPDPNSSGFVQTAVGGQLSPPRGGFPRLGATVKKGDILAYITPPVQTIDVSDMRQRQGELDQQIAIVQRRLARQQTLSTSGAVAQSMLEETRLELEGLRDRRTALDKVQQEPVALIAPVDGVIAEGTPVTGQIAQPNAVVFQIVTPDRLWIEALSFDPVSGSGHASAKGSNGKSFALTFRGSGLADRSQSIPVHFSIDGDTRGLRAGQFLTVFTETGDERKGIAIPRSALVRATNGQDYVFEHVTAERFEPRPVRIEPLDAERVFVAAGIEPGKRIVVQGAELLNQVR